ncbi:PhoH family protein [bacterium]|nr:PhoH family protein [bacterium]
MQNKTSKTKETAKKSNTSPSVLPKDGKKLFVLDTNIPLQDPNCLHGFKDNDVCIPITVIEELDKFKKGNASKNLNARAFLRSISTLMQTNKSLEGASLGKGYGMLSIGFPGKKYPEAISNAFMEDTPDHRILTVAFLKNAEKRRHVVLVTNDINLRMKAIALEINSEDYKNESVEDMDKIYKSISIVKLSEKNWDKIISKSKDDGFLPFCTATKKAPINHLFILKGDDPNYSILARKLKTQLQIIETNPLKCKELFPRNTEQYFAFDALLNDDISLVALTGKAGTGKTLLALAAALRKKEHYEEILVARPAIEMSDKTLGFLPGNKDEKIDPYMMPIYDNLAVLRERLEKKEKKGKKPQENEQTTKDWAKANNIEVLVLNYVRGRSLANKFIIIDEAQNLTPHEIKTIITRAGEGTKIVILGDITQIDSPYQNERSNGISYLIDKWIGQEEFVHVHLTHGERSPLADKAGRIM